MRSAQRGRTVGLLLAGLLVIAVVALIVVPRLGGDAGGGPPDGNVRTVRVLAGSEKRDFFADPAVGARLAELGYRLQVDTAGSREIATSRDLTPYDLAFPADAPQADRIRAARKVTKSYVPFFSPMAIATFQPIASLLQNAGVVRMDGGHRVLNMRGYLDLVDKNTRWSDLPRNTAFETGKSVLISSTDVRTSNSAALYLAIASYVENGGNVVADSAAADRVAARCAPLFVKQGYVEQSTQEPFDDFLTIGMGKTPMAMIYEAQFVARQLAKDGSISPDMVLMYPEPTIYAKHTVVPLTADGDAAGRLLATDPQLQRLAAQHGFRTADAAYGRRLATERGLAPPPSLVDVVEPPTAAIEERMIDKIVNQAQGRPG